MSSQEEGGAAAILPGGAVSTDQTNTNNKKIPEIAISVEERDFILSNDDIEKLKSLDEAFEGEQHLKLTAKPLIQKVPSTLCIPKDFRKYFKPRVISIGPIHHGNPALHGSEQLKLRLAAHFVKNIGVEKETLYKAIKMEIGSLKKCYDPKELEPYDDEKLAWMFFLDGCAILQAILQGDDDQQKKLPSKMNIKNDLLTFVYLDLFLLENQLPHDVLRLLTNSNSNGPGEIFMDSIKRFIDNNVITPTEKKEDKQQHEDGLGEAAHLLDLLRKRLVFKTENRGLMEKFDHIFRSIKDSCNYKRTKTHYSTTFRNVKELRSAGIWLKPSS
ncbi:hypothetical protein V6N13_087719 [Hibiscus sabdariffa]|uniref:Uncharacterized protein n=1 Tax=Hibiscus sabdariffa TaxID=183260 RepID=A0ABR2FX39_9ROSI